MPIIASARSGKEFEKPETGMYHGVLADVVDLGDVTTTYDGKSKTQHMIRMVWYLDCLGKDKVNFPDTFGKQLSVAERFNLSLDERANLYARLKQILNTAPPPEYDVEQLIGITRKVFIIRETGDNGKEYANIKGISAADPSVTVSIPQGFQRRSAKPAPAAPQTASASAAQGADVQF